MLTHILYLTSTDLSDYLYKTCENKFFLCLSLETDSQFWIFLHLAVNDLICIGGSLNPVTAQMALTAATKIHNHQTFPDCCLKKSKDLNT